MRHADEWTYAAEGAQQGAYSSRGCPAGRLPAAEGAQQSAYRRPRDSGDTCLIWAEILASAPQRPPGAVICALSTHMCSDVLSVSSVARAVFLAVFLLLPPPETCPAMIWRWVGATSLPCNASTHLPPPRSIRHAMGSHGSHGLRARQEPWRCCQVGQLPTLRHDLQDPHKLCPCLSRENLLTVLIGPLTIHTRPHTKTNLEDLRRARRKGGVLRICGTSKPLQKPQ